MQTRIVNHQSITFNWLLPDGIKSPKTLVLGSFNPSNGDTNRVDYYYGRYSNHFWQTVARIKKLDENFFFHPIDGMNRKLSVMNNNFCCLDVIDSLKLESESNYHIDEFLKAKIYSNFSDQNIWASNTRNIGIVRTYNERVLETLEKSGSICTVIHTMGKNKIKINQVKPKEARLGSRGFNGYISRIKVICQRKGILFVNESFSPSAYAIRNGNTPIQDLEFFLKTHLF